MPKTIKINTTHFIFIMKIPKKRELRQIASNHLPHIESKDFMKLYKHHSKETFSILVNDGTFSSDNPIRFRKKLL